MQLHLLAECINVLANCDIDNPQDHKKISVCENYISESYKYYLENCHQCGFEPLSEGEYLQEIILNKSNYFNESILSNIQQGVNNVVQKVQPVVQNGVNAVGNAATAVYQKAPLPVQNAVNTVATGANNVIQKGTAAVSRASNNFVQRTQPQPQPQQNAPKKTTTKQKKQAIQRQAAQNTAIAAQARQKNPVQETVNLINTVLANNPSLKNSTALDIVNKSFNEFLDLAESCPTISDSSKYCILENINESEFNNILRETLGYSFNASSLSKPLTPAIKMPAKYD